MEKAKEITTEVKQEVKEAATEVAAKVRPMVQSVSLSEKSLSGRSWSGTNAER